MSIYAQYGVPVLLTASGQVSLQSCVLVGFYVGSTSSGTVVLRNGGAAGTAVSGTITPAVGFHPFPAAFPAGCYATIGATASITFIVAAG